jgi:hypothetical protein
MSDKDGTFPGGVSVSALQPFNRPGTARGARGHRVLERRCTDQAAGQPGRRRRHSGTRAIEHDQFGEFEDPPGLPPAFEGRQVVGSHDKAQPVRRVCVGQCSKGVDGPRRATTVDLARVDQRAGLRQERDQAHGQPIGWPGFRRLAPGGLPIRDHVDEVRKAVPQNMAGHGDMARMHGIEGAAEDGADHDPATARSRAADSAAAAARRSWGKLSASRW